MVGFLMNNKIYEIQSNTQLSVILSQFDSGYVMDVIEETLTNVFNNFDTIVRPNAVLAFEQNFKELYANFPSDLDNINQCRIETYMTIIDFICKKFDLRFIQQDSVDLYTLALNMYDFFVSKFAYNMVEFYTKFIIMEKDNILTTINQDDYRKQRDMSSAYNKTVFGNDESLAIIAANLPDVLKNLSMNLVPDHTVYYTIYGSENQPIIDLMETYISPTVSLFVRFNTILFNEIMYGTIITQIRMRLQQYMGVDINPREAINMA